MLGKRNGSEIGDEGLWNLERESIKRREKREVAIK